VYRLFLSLGLTASLAVAADLFPLDQIRAGMRGTGRTVFTGERVEEFQVEILGILENIGPRQSIILGRLTGGPLAKTGAMAGMSGSPVYLEGKLVGAVALAFPFATEPIVGIRPISEMIRMFEQRADPVPATLRATVHHGRWVPPENPRLLPVAADVLPTQPKLTAIATPVHFAGFTSRTLDVFGPALRELGLEPLQGSGGAASPHSTALGDPGLIQPGSMISVGLVRGDLNVNADGTITHIDGNRIYAFGHRFLSSGPTEMPFMRSSVITLLPNLMVSFKISTAAEMMGTIRQDRSTGIYGELGARPQLIPVELNMYSSRSGNQPYRMEMVNDRFLSPFLLQLMVFSALDASERLVGSSTVRVRGTIEFPGAAPAVELDNIYSGDNSTAILAALGTALPLAQAMQSGFQDLRIGRVKLDVSSLDERKQLKLERAWASQSEAKPGERIELAAVLRGENGAETIRRVPFEIPHGLPPGPLNVTFADGSSMNLMDLRLTTLGRESTSGTQLVRAINRTRRNNCLYVRVWRTDKGFQLQNDQLPSPPASLRQILGAGPSASGGITNTWTALLADMELEQASSAISGSETIRITVKE
jgi:hypothetical protein